MSASACTRSMPGLTSEQVVKVIWHKAASPPYSAVQSYSPGCTNMHPVGIRTVYWFYPLLSCFEYRPISTADLSGHQPSAILVVKIKFLSVARFKRVKVCHHIKFRGDASNHCWVMAVSHLGLLKKSLVNDTVQRVDVHHCAKVRGDRSNHCWDMAIFRFFKTVAVRAIFDFLKSKFSPC